jgi:hypothetical protein
MIDVPYRHLVFTLPWELRLFRAAANAGAFI